MVIIFVASSSVMGLEVLPQVVPPNSAVVHYSTFSSHRSEGARRDSSCQEAPLSLSCHVMSFSEWTMSRGGIVTSRRRIGRTPFVFYYFSSFICWLFVLFGLAAERQGFSGCGRQHWYIQCPLGVCIVIIIHACLIIVVRKSRVLWEFGNDCQTECSSVCTSTDSSSDSCFWFSSTFHLPPSIFYLLSSIFHLPFRSTINVSDSWTDSFYVLTLIVSFVRRPSLLLGQK